MSKRFVPCCRIVFNISIFYYCNLYLHVSTRIFLLSCYHWLWKGDLRSGSFLQPLVKEREPPGGVISGTIDVLD